MVMMISVLRSIGVILLSTLFIIHTNHHHHCNGAPVLPSRTAAATSRISSSSSPSSSLPPVPCTPSSTRICVSFDASSTPGRYMVNTGSGATANGDLTFAAGTSYTFQMTGNKFGTFPFALTTSSTRATTPLTDGVSGRNPASMDGDQLIYTPSSIGPQKVYYQSVLASNLGGAINIVNACNPSPTRVCVYYDESSGSYATNYGPSPLGYGMEAKGDVVLNAGTKYDFQVVGPAFANNPLALSTMDGSAASEEMRYTAGVSGTMPASSDGQTFSFTPSAKGPSTLYYESTMNKGLGGRINIVGACQPSLADHHICVSTNGRTYSIDIGDGQGDQSQRDLVLEAGTPYTLEMASLPGVSESHPFALCNSPKGPCEAPLTDGVTGDNPLASDGMIMTFIPEDHGPTTIYYQSQSDSGMGGKITITNSCNPSDTNICVHNDGTSYSVDQGFGPMAHGDLTLISGVPYTFEMMGSKFKDFPFAFTTEHGTSVKATTMMTDGVSGTSPATMDDQKLIYTPAAKGFTQLRYESTTAPGMGGSITIAGVCNPSRHHICVTMTDDGNYALNNGNGAIANAGLILNAGTKYVFQAQGDAFSEHPFALTAVSSSPSTSTSSYQGSGSASFQPLVDGVDPNSDNPLSGDGQQLVYTPLVVGPSNIFYQSPSSTTKGGRIHIQGACQPNDNRICVTQTDSSDGSGTPVYAVNMGTDDTATRRGPLVLKAGEKYTFEMTGVGSAFTRNPFALTLSPNQATEMITSNITSNNPLVGDDETLVYTPSSQGPATIYYQSTATPNMGGTITIANACNPSHTNICVYQDSVTGIPSPYWIDQGDGRVKQGTIVMYTGTEYTLEAVGNGFATRPLAITQSSMKATTPLTKNLYGDNPLSKDDDKLLFIPDDSTPPSLYYQSLLYSNLGGAITIKQGPAPYTPLTSTQAIEAADAKVTTMAAPPVMIMNTTSDNDGSEDEPVVVDDTKLNPKMTHGGDSTSIDTLEPTNEGGTVDENGHSTGILTDIDTMIAAVNVSKMIHNKNYTMSSPSDNMSTNSSSSHTSRPRIKPTSSLYSSTGGVIIDDSSMTYMDHSSHTGDDSSSSAMDDTNNNMKSSSTSTDDHTIITIPPVTPVHNHDDDSTTVTATGNNGNITDEAPQQRRNDGYGIASSLPSMVSASLLLLADTALALVVSLL